MVFVKVNKMKTVSYTIFILLMLCGAASIKAQKKVVGYYASWYKSYYPADKIDYKNLTHINHSFIAPKKDGSLLILHDFIYPELIQNAHNAGVKVLISVGGADSAITNAFVAMSSNPEIRAKFIGNLVDFVIQNNYDGVDIDWEFPANEIEKNILTTLLKEIREAFSHINTVLFLTIAGTPNDYFGRYFDYGNFVEYVDWISMMAYNFHGSWSIHSGHNAPLYKNPIDPDNAGSVEEGINYLNITRKIPKEKLLVGVSFFGKEFIASDLFANQNGTVNDLIYSDIYPRLQNTDWDYFWDNTSMVPYLLNKTRNKFITFDDTTSIRLKCEYAKNNNLAGIMIWALGYDFINGEAQLLKTIGISLGFTTGIELADYKNEIPSDYKLYDNYPNPFNPTTVIRFMLPASGRVKLAVYDLLGREVDVLFNRNLDPGVYEATFNASNLGSGIYFYTLITGNYIKTKKMILMK